MNPDGSIKDSIILKKNLMTTTTSPTHQDDFLQFTTEYLAEFTPAIKNSSLGFLSIAKDSLLKQILSKSEEVFRSYGVTAKEYYDTYPALRKVKNSFFNYTLKQIENGHNNLIPHLPKGITNKKQLAIYLSLIRQRYDDSLLVAKKHTQLLIYPGSFDPMHYGHRVMIASLLDKTAHSQLVVNVNSYQPRKPWLEETYAQRFADLEYKLLKSDITDPYRTCAVDFRFGVPEGQDYLRQTRMQAFMAGDATLRWVVGGDKFLSEVERVKDEQSRNIVGRSLARFSLPHMSIYIVPRKGQDISLFNDLVTHYNTTCKATFVLVEEKDYEGSPISSTLIRDYLAKDDVELRREAKRMESIDLKREYIL